MLQSLEVWEKFSPPYILVSLTEYISISSFPLLISLNFVQLVISMYYTLPYVNHSFLFNERLLKLRDLTLLVSVMSRTHNDERFSQGIYGIQCPLFSKSTDFVIAVTVFTSLKIKCK